MITFSMQSSVVFAATQQSVSLEPLKPTSVDMIQALDEASRMLGAGIISEEEYTEMLLEIYQLKNNEDICLLISDDDYYPEVQAGYIDHEGVVYLYEEGLRNAETAQGVCMLLAGAMPGAGWGLTAISTVAAYGGKSALEEAVNEAYFTGKGIAVYYQIHVSVQSYNKVRYVVE